MVNTYTTKLNLAKPANGDVNWHIPVNDNFDTIDEKVGEALTISGTVIDADKDWDGKNITNVGSVDMHQNRVDNLYYREFIPSASDTIIASRTGSQSVGRGSTWTVSDTIKIPNGYGIGSVRVGCLIKANYHPNPSYSYNTQAKIVKNGDILASLNITSNIIEEYLTADINIEPNDTITISAYTKHPNVNVEVWDVTVGASLSFKDVEIYSTEIDIV